jgi:hypothetical protein
MKKYYCEPELEIKNYSIVQGRVLTTSFPEEGSGESKDTVDLNKDDIFDPYG